MSILKPKIPNVLTEIDDLISFSEDFRENEIRIKSINIKNDNAKNADMYRIDICGSKFQNCTFINCNFEKAEFEDIIFENCDFSNSNLSNTYFNRCEFINCKCIGVNLGDSVLKNTFVSISNFQYSLFDRSKLNCFSIMQSDFSNSSISEAELKKIECENSKLIGINFFRTMLKDVDFSKSDLQGIIISDSLEELRGCTLNEYQTADIVKLLGVTVK